MNNLIKKTLAKINKEHIDIEPRWIFLLKKYLVWLGVIFLIILGSGAISVIYYLILQLDWDLHQVLHRNTFLYKVSILPYFWLFILGIFLAITFFGIRKTEGGYRFSWTKMGLIIFCGFIFFGLFFRFFGFDGKINSLMMNKVPYSLHHTITKDKQWMQPSQGLLAGTILIIEKNYFELKDLENKKWVIYYDKKTIIRPSIEIISGEKVKLIGAKKDEQIFQVSEIRPWEGRGMMHRWNK
jgi:hypothetical protein